MDSVWDVLLGSTKLASTEQEGKVLVVIEAPYTMRTCRFKEVCQLKLSHEDQVALENFIDCGTQIAFIVNTKLV